MYLTQLENVFSDTLTATQMFFSLVQTVSELSKLNMSTFTELDGVLE